MAWSNGCQHHPRQCRACPKWCCLSANHHQGGQPCQCHVHPKQRCLFANHHQGGWPHHISKQYNHQRSLWGGESLLTPPQIKPPPWAARVHRTTEDLAQEGREAAANPSVTPEVCQGRRLCSHCIRRAICPPGQCPVPHHHQHLKEPSLSGEVGQGPPSAIPHGLQQTFVAVVGGRTWSISSGSTTNSALPPLGRQNGRGSRSSSLTTSSSIRRKPWPSRKHV